MSPELLNLISSISVQLAFGKPISIDMCTKLFKLEIQEEDVLSALRQLNKQKAFDAYIEYVRSHVEVLAIEAKNSPESDYARVFELVMRTKTYSQYCSDLKGGTCAPSVTRNTELFPKNTLPIDLSFIFKAVDSTASRIRDPRADEYGFYGYRRMDSKIGEFFFLYNWLLQFRFFHPIPLKFLR